MDRVFLSANIKRNKKIKVLSNIEILNEFYLSNIKSNIKYYENLSKFYLRIDLEFS